MRAAIYSRVSTAEQSADNQLEQLRAYAATQGWGITAEYLDTDSGAHYDRPGFQQMLAAARQRRFDVLLFWSLDRLTREGAARTLDILNRLHSWGVRFRSFTEEYLDSCGLFADAVVAILAAIAQQERQRISERTRAGLERARKQGRRLGRPPRQVPLAAAQELLSDGLSLRAAARQLKVSPDTLRRRLACYPKASTASDRPATARPATNHISPAPGADPDPLGHSIEGSLLA